jgi:hypothetical protein
LSFRGWNAMMVLMPDEDLRNEEKNSPAHLDLFLKMLREAENTVDYEYHPHDGLALTASKSGTPGVAFIPNVKSVVWVFQKDAEGKNIHRAWFSFNAQGQLKFVTIE